jgi:hypothetical protein
MDTDEIDGRMAALERQWFEAHKSELDARNEMRFAEQRCGDSTVARSRVEGAIQLKSDIIRVIEEMEDLLLA